LQEGLFYLYFSHFTFCNKKITTTPSLSQYFKQLGFNEKETVIYTTLRKLGTKPASTIASVCGYERVYTYKALQRFVQEWLIAETVVRSVKHFWIPSLDLLAQYVRKHEEKYRGLQEEFTYIKTSFESLQKHTTASAPRLQLFEGMSWCKLLFADITQEITKHDLITIKFFGTNTFETQLLSSETVKDFIGDFLQFLDQQHVSVQSYIADGSLIMEHLTISETIQGIENLPAGNNAINFFIVGQIFYLLIYKEKPIGLKLESPELAWAMHFLLEQTQQKKP